MISLGSLAFLGVALLAWWLADGSRELWTLGVTLILTGQFGLLFGLALQLTHLRKVNRHSAESLAELHQQFRQMNHAKLPSAPYLASSEFYNRLAG